MADGFLRRWSRRKLEVEAGKPVPAEPPVAPPAAPAVAQAPVHERPPEPPPPTLEDVAELTPESDFSRFSGSKVAPEVKNAAMKKLFSDPHFNVMDGLDIYIEDYGQPDPIPAQMLRSLVSAQALGLFAKEGQDTEGRPATGENPPSAVDAPETVAQWAPVADPAPEPSPLATDADPDLRLQQDPAPGPAGPGPGAP